jgi:Ser/Thr protein kinase RdoA (MazF antagonist)
MSPNLTTLATIASQFSPAAAVNEIRAFGSGNINDTYLVTGSHPSTAKFVLQRINTQVFQQPELVMQNMRTFTEHVRERLACDPLDPDCLWQVPQVLLTQEGQDHWLDEQGQFWRAISFIEASESFDTIQDMRHASEIGYALGMFHRLVSDLPPQQLADTLKGFHITPNYLSQYNDILACTLVPGSPEVNYCCQFVRERQGWATVLEDAKQQGKLPIRTMHGDPKINNVMFDTATHKAVSMIDLDTVKPGLVHYDIGDCLRSACNPLGEETDQWNHVYFDTDLCCAILQGYLAQAQDFLTENDYHYLYDAIRLIAFELGLRFFADYLAGNVYFKIKYPEHNLARALVQFKLVESIEAQAPQIQALLQDLR